MAGTSGTGREVRGTMNNPFSACLACGLPIKPGLIYWQRYCGSTCRNTAKMRRYRAKRKILKDGS